MSEPFDLDVERVVPGGAGLGRLDGRVVLVEGGLPGDRVRAISVSESPRLVQGVLREVLVPGPVRRSTAEMCPLAASRLCGGCDWNGARLDAHRELKTALVTDALRRLGGLANVPPLRFHASPPGYRLRNRLHVDGAGAIGFYAPRSNTVAPLSSACEIGSPAFLARLSSAPISLPAGELRTLESLDGRTVLAELLLAGQSSPEAAVTQLRRVFDGARVSDSEGRVLAEDGPTTLSLPAGGAAFTVSVSSFFQGNRYLLDAFLNEVVLGFDGVSSRGAAWDLYAGAGFLSWPLLARGFRVTAVEPDGASSADLATNARAFGAAGFTRLATVRGTAESFLAKARGPVDVSVADPPRAGLSPAVRAALLRLRPQALVLVSCDPATLARDVKALAARYEVADGALLDLFPITHHVETVLQL
ncbi:MAG: class I SAM-dependent RNA methyltransferase, partial [Acidobacteria bacterium]|nr:class I SAM-dependent RNA methyltransferase [Acidobacteriota bacterium]